MVPLDAIDSPSKLVLKGMNDDRFKKGEELLEAYLTKTKSVTQNT